MQNHIGRSWQFRPPRERALWCLAAAAFFASSGAAIAGIAGPAFPLKASDNNRFLVDQNNVPFMMVGDSPQSLIGNLTTDDAAFFMDNRQSYGVNALWINLLCDSYTACRSDGTTYDGIAPFTTPGDLSTPNPAFFDRAATMIDLASARGMAVMLDPIETGGWLGVLDDNGVAKARAYGRFLGQRFKHFKNIIWQSGNDFQSWRDPNQDRLVAAVANGIKDTDTNHIHTIELDYYVSASADDSRWRQIIGLDATYTYRPTYAKLLSEYARANYKPVYMVEANYEFEHNGGTDGGSTQNLRRQEYWTMLSGATGQLYGSAYSWTFQSGWQDHLDTIGIQQLCYMRQLFQSQPWYGLVPDRAHEVLTNGFGHFSKTDPIPDDTYATAAATADGTLVMAYLPSIRKVTVDMSKLAAPATGQWFDPTNATYSTISGSPFQNAGKMKFTPPGDNSAGDGDWVLILKTD